MKKTKTKLAIIASLAVLLLWSVSPSPRTVIKGNKTINSNLVLKDGMISPGNSPGKVTVNGDLTLGSTATYKCELKDLTGAGTGHDQIEATGSITLDGTLDIVLDGYTPDDADKFEVMKYGTTLSGTFSTVNGLPAGWQIDYGVQEPNMVTIYGQNSTIPIELLNFTAVRQKESVILKWQTASERNSDYFTIEHSTDAKNFSSLDRIKAQGISNNVQRYSFEHHTPAKGINYYRLKQVDLDEKFAYSNIIAMELGKEKYTFYPNPANKSITFNQPCDVIVIYDISGKEIIRKEKVTTTLDISSLKQGMYIIDVNKGEYKDKIIIK